MVTFGSWLSISRTGAEASVLIQSFPGVEGTGFDTGAVPQPGTVGFLPFRGPIGTRPLLGSPVFLPGSRGRCARTDLKRL